MRPYKEARKLSPVCLTLNYFLKEFQFAYDDVMEALFLGIKKSITINGALKVEKVDKLL